MKVILIMAVTLDGKIAKHKKHLANWTSPEDKKFFIQTTKKIGVIIMGRTTYATLKRPLPQRLNIVLTSQPSRYKTKNIKGLLEFTNKKPRELLRELKKRGYKKVVLAGGAAINTLFLKENLIDEIWLTLEPKIFGQGLSLFKNYSTFKNLKLLEVKKLNPHTLQLKYKVIK